MPTTKLPLPYKGVHRYNPRGEQPEGTTWYASNVLPIDRQGRRRLASRPGITTLHDATTGTFRLVMQVRYPSGINPRDYLFTVLGEDIKVGDLTTISSVTSGDGIVDGPAERPEAAVLDGKVYVVDGESITRFDPDGPVATNFVASLGTAPAGARLITMWRGRLVYAGESTFPQNFYFSRQGDPTDHDYAETDAAAAVAGNAGTLGRIGWPITALIPFSNDTLIIGTTRDIHIMSGDPADGGTLDLLTGNTGIAQARSWAIDPTGALWFVGAGGLMRVAPAPGSTPENVSRDIYPQFFDAINPDTHYIDLQWDHGRHGLWVFVTHKSTGGTTHLFVDARGKGFWPVVYPAAAGPFASAYYLGDDSDDRLLLLGGNDGTIYYQSDTATNDDVTTPIVSKVEVGPFQLVDGADSTIIGIDVTGGETGASDWNMQVGILGGKTAYSASEGTESFVAGSTFTTPGLAISRVFRVRGGWHTLTFGNSTADKQFAIESVGLTFMPAGKQRP